MQTVTAAIASHRVAAKIEEFRVGVEKQKS